jgi:hypothetical protein
MSDLRARSFAAWPCIAGDRLSGATDPGRIAARIAARRIPLRDQENTRLAWRAVDEGTEAAGVHLVAPRLYREVNATGLAHQQRILPAARIERLEGNWLEFGPMAYHKVKWYRCAADNTATGLA